MTDNLGLMTNQIVQIDIKIYKYSDNNLIVGGDTMGNPTYEIVGRYMDGNSVIAYHMIDHASGKSGRFTREQVIHLIGKGRVMNCKAQLYKDKVILRGTTVSLEQLPVKMVDGKISRTKNMENSTSTDIMNQVVIIYRITNNNAIVGYVVKNPAGRTNNINKATALKLAMNNKIGNAKYTLNNGVPGLVGVGMNLSSLKTVELSKLQSGGN